MIEHYTSERSYVVHVKQAIALYGRASAWGLAQLDGRWQVALFDRDGNRCSTLVLPYGMDYVVITGQRPTEG